MNNLLKKNINFNTYLNNIESPYLQEKIISKITTNTEGNSILTLKKIINKKDLSLKLKPKLNKTNVNNNYQNLIKYTDTIKKNYKSQK